MIFLIWMIWMNLSNLSPDEEHLFLLMKDFPCENQFPFEKATKVLELRYHSFETLMQTIIFETIKILDQKISSISSSDKLISAFQTGNKFPFAFSISNRFFHKILFDNILGNAGQFRKLSDPNNGSIFFGSPSKRILGNLEFCGSNPANIESDLKDIFIYLNENSTDPLKDALMFYQKFVKIHPFYDANGRIARMLIEIYLLHFNKQILWKSLLEENKTQFIRKLNKCHKYNTPEHMKYFVDFFSRYVVDIPEAKEENPQ